MKIEYEVRGRLKEQDYSRVVDYLAQNAKKLKEFSRFSLRYETVGFRVSSSDLRVRFEEGRSEIVLKIGKYGASDREEMSLNVDRADVSTAIKMLSYLGFDKGYAFWRITKKFKYKGCEVSIVEVPNYCRYFEIELLSDVEDPKIVGELESVAKDLGLECFRSEAVYFDFLEDLDKNANIDFSYGKSNLEDLMDKSSRIWQR